MVHSLESLVSFVSRARCGGAGRLRTDDTRHAGRALLPYVVRSKNRHISPSNPNTQYRWHRVLGLLSSRSGLCTVYKFTRSVENRNSAQTALKTKPETGEREIRDRVYAISTAFTSYFRQRGPGTRLVRSPSSSTHPQRGRLRRRHTTRRGRSARWARSAGRRGRRAPWRRARSCPR